jgi:hypothetical protein
MQVASVGQSVEVSAAAAIVNTESGTLGDTKNFNPVVQLPVNYRGATTSPLAAMATVPGAQQDAQGNVSLSGGTPSQYSVDGVSTVNIRQNGALGNMNASSELISEFKVTQFNNNAEFSQAATLPLPLRAAAIRFTAARSSICRTVHWTQLPTGSTPKRTKYLIHSAGASADP